MPLQRGRETGMETNETTNETTGETTSAAGIMDITDHEIESCLSALDC